MKKIFAHFIFIIIALNSFGDEFTFERENFSVNVNSTNESPEIDGIVNEDEWKGAKVFDNFWQHSPNDDKLADFQTEVRVTYDETYIYIAAKLYDDDNPQIVQSLKRDGQMEYWRSDNFSVVLDPLNTKNTGYIFGVNAGGAQMEGILSQNGNRTGMDTNWDNIWLSKVAKEDDCWTVEMAIPFSSIQFKENTEWGINFLRGDMKRNEFSTWTRFPRNFQGIDLGYTGEISLENIPSISSNKVVIVPSIIDGMSEDYENETNLERNFNAGIDGKIAVSSSLKLDLTANPDFSQVEVDQQVTNLSRFSPFFPEKRTFFLENSDIFSNLGTHGARPIFTRNIGLKDGETIPILFGLRLSGNVSENLRVGIMDVQTGNEGDIRSENFGVLAFQQQILERSSIKGFFVNRQQTNSLSFDNNEFNRVGGAEFHYLSKGGNFRGTGMYHQSFTRENYDQSGFYNVGMTYNTRTFFYTMSGTRMGENYLAETGFTPRLYNFDADQDTMVRRGFWNAGYRTNYRIYPKNSKAISFHFLGSYSNVYLNDDGSLNEYSINLDYMMRFKSMSNLYVRYNTSKVDLPYSTYIINSDNPLPSQEYSFNSLRVSYNSPTKYKLSSRIFGEYGTFYSGTKATLGTEVNFRTQPWGRFGIDYRLNKVDLGGIYGNQDLHQFGAKTEIAFSNKMFWTNFIQYNTQWENFNINSRFQWRYRPMSDIYLVFTNNYNTYDFSSKNIAIVLKISYWLHM